VRVDGQGRLHCETGPALVLQDGTEFCYWHGMIVDAIVVADPARLTVRDIMAEQNVEHRRIMIARKGIAAIVRESNPEVVDQDADTNGNPRRLYRIKVTGTENAEPLVVLHVIDEAKRRQGLKADVFLQVHPDCIEVGMRDRTVQHTFRDGSVRPVWVRHVIWKAIKDSENNDSNVPAHRGACRRAVAWTFGLNEDDFRPSQET